MQNKENRRCTNDRRHTDYGPPSGWRERRRRTERRLPTLAEEELTESQFLIYFGERSTFDSDEETTEVQIIAAEVLSRSRD